MRPQEPGGPPFRGHGTGGETTRTDAPGRGAHARPDDDDVVDPYGDVPAPAPAGPAPYGSSGWTGSDRPSSGDSAYGDVAYGYVADGESPGYGDGTSGAGHGFGTNGHAGHGDRAAGMDGRHGPGPSADHGGHPGPGGLPEANGSSVPPPGPWGSGHASQPPPAQPPPAQPPPAPAPPFSPPQPPPHAGPRPDGRPFGPFGPTGQPGQPGQPGPQANGLAGRPAGSAPASPPASPPLSPQGSPPPPPQGPPQGPSHGPPPSPQGPPQGAGSAAPPAGPPGPPPARTPAPTSEQNPAAERASSSGTAGPDAAAASSPADGGLAGSDGFASRSPRPPEGGSSTTTTTTAFTGGAGAGPGRHRRAGLGPGRDEEAPEDGEDSAPGRRGDVNGRGGKGGGKGKTKKKGSFWRELPLLIVVAIVLTFVIQTFIARIYVIPSASMEQTLHGCNGCANDRVAVDKLTYRFSDPAPGDVVVFRGPPTWADNGEVAGEEPSGNVLVRGLQSGLSLVGLAPPNEKDFVKRVIAVGGQTVACCDPQNRVTVDGQPLDEPYIYYQPNLGRAQSDFAPVRVPEGQLWVMGDNRNNSSDARVHGPIGVTDVIGKARMIVLPVGRWGGVPDTDPQARPSALGAPVWTSGAPLAAGALGAVPLVVVSRRLRRRWTSNGGWTSPDGGPEPSPPSPDTGR